MTADARDERPARSAPSRVDVEPGASTLGVVRPRDDQPAQHARARVQAERRRAGGRQRPFNFVLSPADPVRVMLVDRGGGDRPLLARALAIGEAPKFDVVTRQPETPCRDDDLRRSALVVLNDVPVPAPLARRLLKFVEGGGGLLVAAGAARQLAVGRGRCCRRRSAHPVDRTRGDGGAGDGGIEFGHAGVRGVPRAAQRRLLVDARLRLPQLAAGDRRAGAGAVRRRRARRAGDAGSARAACCCGRRRSTSRWTDLPIRPVFLPFVHRAATHLVAYVPPQPCAHRRPDARSRRRRAPARARAPPRVLLTPVRHAAST